MEEFEKITDNNFDEIFDNLDLHLSDKVSSWLNGYSNDYYSNLCESLIDCESPIEQLLSLALEESQIRNINYWNPNIDLNYGKNQEIICKNGKKYRLDFYFVVAYYNNNKIIKTKYYDIECDGYDYHNKTKEQVIYDNQRARDLQQMNIETIRFSGTEIWISPNKCVNQIKDIILSNCKKEK